MIYLSNKKRILKVLNRILMVSAIFLAAVAFGIGLSVLNNLSIEQAVNILLPTGFLIFLIILSVAIITYFEWRFENKEV